MSEVLIKMLIIIMSNMSHWSEHQITDFCEQVDPYIKHEPIDETEIIKFLDMIIEVENSKK